MMVRRVVPKCTPENGESVTVNGVTVFIK